ncbi:MAG: DUF4296 domain-containing protein [Bacteroidota bacterium]
MNKTFGVLFFLLAFFFTACGPKEDERLPDDRLINLLADIHLAEAAMQQAYKETKDSLAGVYYEQIYTIHKVSEAQLEAELKYLQSHPDLAEAIYGQVLEVLNERDLRNDNKQSKPDKKK